MSRSGSKRSPRPGSSRRITSLANDWRWRWPPPALVSSPRARQAVVGFVSPNTTIGVVTLRGVVGVDAYFRKCRPSPSWGGGGGRGPAESQ
jgi:hypothetical protein